MTLERETAPCTPQSGCAVSARGIVVPNLIDRPLPKEEEA